MSLIEEIQPIAPMVQSGVDTDNFSIEQLIRLRDQLSFFNIYASGVYEGILQEWNFELLSQIQKKDSEEVRAFETSAPPQEPIQPVGGGVDIAFFQSLQNQLDRSTSIHPPAKAKRSEKKYKYIPYRYTNKVPISAGVLPMVQAPNETVAKLIHNNGGEMDSNIVSVESFPEKLTLATIVDGDVLALEMRSKKRSRDESKETDEYRDGMEMDLLDNAPSLISASIEESSPTSIKRRRVHIDEELFKRLASTPKRLVEGGEITEETNLAELEDVPYLCELVDDADPSNITEVNSKIVISEAMGLLSPPVLLNSSPETDSTKPSSCNIITPRDFPVVNMAVVVPKDPITSDFSLALSNLDPPLLSNLQVSSKPTSVRDFMEGEKYVCIYCSQNGAVSRYAQKGKLKSHLETRHPTEFANLTATTKIFQSKSNIGGGHYVCPVPGCGHSFNQMCSRNRHIKMKHSERAVAIVLLAEGPQFGGYDGNEEEDEPS